MKPTPLAFHTTPVDHRELAGPDPVIEIFARVDAAAQRLRMAAKAYEVALSSVPLQLRRVPVALVGVRADAGGHQEEVFANSHDEIDREMDLVLTSLDPKDTEMAAHVEAFRRATHEALDADMVRINAVRDESGVTSAVDRHAEALSDLLSAQVELAHTEPNSLEGCALLASFLHERSVNERPDINLIATAARHLDDALSRLTLGIAPPAHH